MAAFLELRRNADQILVELEYLAKEAEYAREFENRSALVIQSVWRGYRVRTHNKFLYRCATIIQTWWRIYKAKILFRQKLKEHVVQLRLKYYDDNAVKIQKIWRGYYVRKYVLDYYSRKRYLYGLEQKNEQIRSQLNEYREYLEQKQVEQQRQANISKLEEEARRTHYLVSTRAVPGIYNSKYLEAPKEMEIILRTAKFEVPPLTKPIKNSKDQTMSTLTKFLPPLKPKPQGPFRQPEEVRYQRYRPLKPSLRCETDYFATEKMR
jgi:myosin heavy subunit